MRKIVFVTGTRADFGKLKPLIRAVHEHPDYEYTIFVTGMHLLYQYGFTVDEVRKAGFHNIFTFMNQVQGEPMEMVLANTIKGLSRYMHEVVPDMLVVHGDRVEALAGAITGALRNVLVGHVEGGEISGTVDELIRHAVTKMSHIHFVANEEAADRLRQLGEQDKSIYVIGSPDVDIMLSDDLPTIEEVKSYYDIGFDEYGVVLYHPVTTEVKDQRRNAEVLVESLLESGNNYVVIHPNNDTGSEEIFHAYKKMEGLSCFRIFPSMRFEYFITLLRHSQFLIGNSSAGVRETPTLAVPSINLGTRQHNRYRYSSILNANMGKAAILESIEKALSLDNVKPSHHFGYGNSVKNFMLALGEEMIWETEKQKQFLDIFF
ncbi:UDP-N-acetylglucosamine 2-epimerase [Desulfogranum marinum]|uniref:UDP-N-acetylglucosamine 2-epimerase n=1 Tax=Desulfogranum marinum TaxID=453220 RepID=UPI001963DDC1|nr:UDP-N-acetylglucosamine 2-epimerase [Desulfogranum marinum]MBM9513003.1 UDP-N-acetylglucosamine 2-epimerase (hydrolyzing) [Desulfogranum marinum]